MVRGRGLEPLRIAPPEFIVWLTLVHCSMPEWFAQKGGFRKANFPYFLRYVEKMGKFLNDYVDVWIVLNEFFSGGWGGDDMRFDYIKSISLNNTDFSKSNDACCQMKQSFV